MRLYLPACPRVGRACAIFGQHPGAKSKQDISPYCLVRRKTSSAFSPVSRSTLSLAASSSPVSVCAALNCTAASATGLASEAIQRPCSRQNDHMQRLRALMRADCTVLGSLLRAFIALYFTSSTGTALSTTTRWATLPMRARPIQPWPWVPITIKSTCSFFAA